MFFQELLKTEEIYEHCNGRGTCGKCTIRFTGEAPLPVARDRSYFTPDQLREGYRLGCQVQGDCLYAYEVPQNETHLSIVTTNTLTKRHFLSNDHAKDSQQPKSTILSVDIGTTTIAMALWKSDNYDVMKSIGYRNPQVRFGADVLSRMQASLQGNGKTLQNMLLETITEGLQAITKLQRPDICVIAGNTTMIHLLQGYETKQLMTAPFCSLLQEKETITIDRFQFQIVPSISAFVGGDITAGILAAGMEQSEKIKLMIDLGTNGEMVLGNCRRMIATATAAGPAFEGGFQGQIKGSDMCSLISDLISQKIIDEQGLMKEPYFSQGFESPIGRILQQDIRNIQMAKAAIAAGIKILTEKYGIEITEIEEVVLAGGFGYYIDKKKAANIGLLPKILVNKTISAGNTALFGACLFGNRDWMDLSFLKRIEVINLALETNFQEYYVNAMDFH